MGLKRLKQPTILNAKGEPITLTRQEAHLANHLQVEMNKKFENSLGYEIPITTLTTIMKKISQQKFFEISPADFIPVVVGEGAWSSNLTTYRSFDMADEFETGMVNTGGQNSRLATADAGVDSLNILVYNWAKTIGWNIMDLELAAKSGNWDIVTAKEISRKRNWDLGIQRVAFLGARGNNGVGGSCVGLLNQSGIAVNTTVIPKSLKSMSPTELSLFQQSVIEAYRSNNNRTAWPSIFVIPESDYNGLAAQAAPEFPVVSKLKLLEDAFKVITRNPSFKILPLAYADAAYSGFAYQQYVLLNYDEESIRVNVPVPYTNTLANSLDNFSFQNVGYGQFTGVTTLRPLEVMYFQYTAS